MVYLLTFCEKHAKKEKSPSSEPISRFDLTVSVHARPGPKIRVDSDVYPDAVLFSQPAMNTSYHVNNMHKASKDQVFFAGIRVTPAASHPLSYKVSAIIASVGILAQFSTFHAGS